MADRLYRKVLIETPQIPATFEVLWGPDDPDGRAVIEAEANLSEYGGLWSRMKIQVGVPGGYAEKIGAGTWLLVKYSRTLNPLSTRDYIEIEERTARLRDGRIAHTNAEITQEQP